jgi:hypothetical protein
MRLSPEGPGLLPPARPTRQNPLLLLCLFSSSLLHSCFVLSVAKSEWQLTAFRKSAYRVPEFLNTANKNRNALHPSLI